MSRGGLTYLENRWCDVDGAVFCRNDRDTSGALSCGVSAVACQFAISSGSWTKSAPIRARIDQDPRSENCWAGRSGEPATPGRVETAEAQARLALTAATRLGPITASAAGERRQPRSRRALPALPRHGLDCGLVRSGQQATVGVIGPRSGSWPDVEFGRLSRCRGDHCRVREPGTDQ